MEAPTKPSPHDAKALLCSAASDTAIAWARVTVGMVIEGAAHLRDDTEHIFMAELCALCGAAAGRRSDSDLHVIDNSALSGTPPGHAAR